MVFGSKIENKVQKIYKTMWKRNGYIVISYSFVALWRPGNVKCLLRVVALATLQNLRGTSRHLEESTIWPGKVVPREFLVQELQGK